jgi:SnoaL-like protein
MRKENSMMRENQNNNRTAHLLALMKKGDGAFNARDFAAVDATHHPDMVANITGNAQPIYGRAAHAAAMEQMLAYSPTCTCTTTPTRSSSEAATGSPS